MSDEVTAITDVSAPPEVIASACLVVIYLRGGQAGKCFKLHDAPLRIGRDADNQIQLVDHGVSRRHARIECLE
jgi:Inner membrane component of T3SS, cytoplasmic domain